jgi:hypothetical protein
MSLSIITRPSALVPLAMSLLALGLVLAHYATYGNVRQEDEGTAARIFQLLLVGQIPIVAFFALRWLPRAPRPALLVLALQCAAGLAAISAVVILERT